MFSTNLSALDPSAESSEDNVCSTFGAGSCLWSLTLLLLFLKVSGSCFLVGAGSFCNESFFCLLRVLFCSSVLNLCELVALRPDLARLKKVLYFHENQLVYPVRKDQERDFQYGYNQVLSW